MFGAREDFSKIPGGSGKDLSRTSKSSKIAVGQLSKKGSFSVADVFQDDRTSAWVSVFWELYSSIASTFFNYYKLVNL